MIINEFKSGELGIIFNSKFKLFPRKLNSKWSGPFKVKEVKSHGTVEVEDPTSQVKWVVNGHKLKPYLDQNDNNIIVIPLNDP